MTVLRIAGIGPPGLYTGLPSNGQAVTSVWQLPRVLGNIVEILLWVIAVGAVIMVIIAGIRYITSEGDPNKIATAKSALTNAIIGVVLSASAYLIVGFIAGRL